MMIAILVFVALFAYVQIGYWFGRWSWHVWDKTPRERFTARLLFPLTAREGKEYGSFNPGKGNDTFIADYQASNRAAYCYAMCAIWPAKFLWCFGAALFVVLYAIVTRTLLAMIHGPGAFVGLFARLPSVFRAWGEARAKSAMRSAPTRAFVADQPVSPASRIEAISTEIARLEAEQLKLRQRPDAARL